MKNAKHTPAPWTQAHTSGHWHAQTIAGHDKHGQSVVYEEQSGKTIAVIYDGIKHANLIAAAPELLAELITAQETLRTGQGFRGSMMDNSMSAAIAKAKGE